MKSFLASSRTFLYLALHQSILIFYLTKETVTDFNPTDCDRYLLTRKTSISKSPTQTNDRNREAWALPYSDQFDHLTLHDPDLQTLRYTLTDL